MTPSDLSGDDLLDRLRAALGAQYAVEHQLGKGGMGAVFLARDLTLERLVAIKVISPDVADSTALRERFLLEARSVARLRHPNIVSVYTAGESSGLAYFVMEYVPGESLRDLMQREGSFTGERAERIVREIALALDYAHQQGLIHRDVKPENILLDTESGRAMLTDFGIARAFETDAGVTQAGMIVGSPRYMAPEQASGDRAIDGRSDLYTLSLVAYELFTGAPVVRDGSVASMLVRHVTETPPPLAVQVKGLAAHVANAVDRGLEKDPDRRWQTGREFADALAGAPLVATGQHGSPTSRSRTPRAFKIAGTAILLAIAAMASWYVRRMGAPTATAYLVTPFEVQSGDPSVRWLREGSVNMLTLTLGQWADLNVINYERTLSLLDAAGLGTKERVSLDDALKVAREAGASTVVMGQVQATRDSLIVSAKLFDVRSGKALQQAQRGGVIGDDPRPLYDRLAQDLLVIAGGPASGVQLSQATTTSLEAYRAYLEGVKLLNNWRLVEADTAFLRAITIDSTFALAHHKRSLGLGWSEAGGTQYAKSAATAASLASRLPPREAALVQGHYHLSRGMSSSLNPNGSRDRKEYDAAIAVYRGLLARDSLVAEAWYGIADAYFHGQQLFNDVDSSAVYATGALNGFHKTLAIDSTFHLAYSHLVQLYNFAAIGVNVSMVGDSVFIPIGKAGDATAALKEAARARGVEIARAWARADPRSAQPILQLAQSFAAAGQSDSALVALRAALANPLTAQPVIRLTLLSTQLGVRDTGTAATLRYVLDHYTADSVRSVSVGTRLWLNGTIVTAAGMLGRMSDVERAARLLESTDSTLPFSRTPTAPMLRMYRLTMRLALGEPVTPDMARELLAMARGLDTLSGATGNQARASALSMPLVAFLATSDTMFAHYLRKWSQSPWPELNALTLLQQGDTAGAERIARTFATPDSLRKPAVRFGLGGLRALTRAEVLARAGLTRQAAETYEAIDPARVNFNFVIEPGVGALVHSLLTRARLWRQLGERDRAIAAYEEFIRLWKDAEGIPGKEVALARQELNAMRDARR